MGIKDNLQFIGSLVRIASWITANARINLFKAIMELG